ncbi:hypothetical protein [Streptomonospora wellingtoniae]|uniref:Ferric siderophore reductase C-terminal domain-containing protein n=1 Tax=Streptomonospora wellingtoniae TaxID=3075544 RepID=A0ABU2KQX5_9ACTN|nr:hypothetical protein [Streptomonospora sp. DSM 45055]MDT0301582.1 hypothetical protein [Streptomonospora sp. DSM 45055]
MPGSHPLSGVVDWVNERDLYFKTDLLGARDPEPRGAEWVRLDRVPEHIPELLDRLTEATCQGHRISASAFLAADLGRQVLTLAAMSAYLTGRAPRLEAHLVWVRRMEGGRLDRVALRRSDAAVLPGDPMAGRPDTVTVESEDELDRWFVGSAAAALEPAVHAVRATTRFGLRPQWSMVADALHSALLLASEEVGADQTAAWERARRMVQCLNLDRSRVAPRQRPFPLALAGRPQHRPERMFMVAGGCCFYYRFSGQRCSTCPLSTDEERESLLRGHFEPQAQTGTASA